MSWYTQADRFLGGYLPGGVHPDVVGIQKQAEKYFERETPIFRRRKNRYEDQWRVNQGRKMFGSQPRKLGGNPTGTPHLGQQRGNPTGMPKLTGIGSIVGRRYTR